MKIGEVRFSTKIQTGNVFIGKTNSRGLLRQNWAKFSSGTILPPNAPYSRLGPEKRYGAGFIKKFQPKKCFLEWMRLHSGTLLPPIDETSLRETFVPNRAIQSVWPRKLVRCDLVHKFKPKTCFLGWTKLRSGTLLPPIAPSSPFGHENRWGAI